MAPGAHALFVGGADCLDESLTDAVNKIVDGHLAQIVPLSDVDIDDLAAWFGSLKVQVQPASS